MAEPAPGKYDDLEIDAVIAYPSVTRPASILVIQWTCGSLAGYGDFYMIAEADGSIRLDHQCMSKEFCIALMTKLIEKYYQ